MIVKGERVLKNVAMITTIIMILSTMASISSSEIPGTHVSSGMGVPYNGQNLGNRVNIACAQNLTARSGNGTYGGPMNVLVTFSLQNKTRLSDYLSNLVNPQSSLYHKYLTRKQFEQNFSLPEVMYRQAVNYFSGYSGISVKTYSDRVSLELQGNANAIGTVFGTSIVYDANHTVYEPDSFPTLPGAIASEISQVSGLNNAKVATISPLSIMGNLISSSDSTTVDGYPSPIISSSGAQYLFGSDLQVAYNEQSLLNVTYPTNEVIATILWAGNSSSGQHVAPFDPADIYDYYNHTIPAGEPHARIYGVPLDHAMPPGPTADEDTTGAYIENTLDLEMAGSMAPGSSIYNVYGPEPTESCLNAAFAYILNPGNKYSGLNNVSVITNSWGTPEFNNTAWYEYLQEAQARGITVLASSGDSGNNPASPEYEANPNHPNDFLNFPAAMAYDNFGVTSVGGTTLTVNNNLQISSQVAWYETIGESILGLFKIGEVVGSVGGISNVYPETTWQKNTEANVVINGAGLGVPDIGAIANNTAICVSVNDQITICGVAGTSVASPTEAGIVAEMNAVLNKFGKSDIGYLNPLIFNLGNKQNLKPGTDHSASISSSLPVMPFYNVHSGANYAYKAVKGYNLVTGWGSINAYNFTIYLLDRNFNYDPNGVSSLKANVNLTSVFANSTLYNGKQQGFSMVQSYYVSDELGSPLYRISSFANFSDERNGRVRIQMGLLAEPPLTNLNGQMPLYNSSDVSFYVNNMLGLNGSFVNRFTNNSDVLKSTLSLVFMGHTVSMNIPGGAYIIGGNNYTYVPNVFSYSGALSAISYQNGTLSPKLGFLSLYQGGAVNFTSGTEGKVTLVQEEMGMNGFQSTISDIYNGSANNINSNILWARDHGSWIFYNQSKASDDELYTYIPSYEVIFQEKGLRTGTPWIMSVDQGTSEKDTMNSMSVYLVNGTYNIGFKSEPYVAVPENYSFTVSGSARASIPVEFQSPSNRTLLRQLDGLDPVENITLPSDQIDMGFLNETLKSGQYSVTSYPGSENIFLTYNGMPYVYVVNISTVRVIAKIQMGKNSSPQSLTYDNATSQILVYSSGTGNVSIINPLTFRITKSFTAWQFKGYNSTLRAIPGSENAVLFNNMSGFEILNITSGIIQSRDLSQTAFQHDSPDVYASKQYVYLINSIDDTLGIYSGNGNIKNLTLESGFNPETLFYSGYGQILYISGGYGNAYTILEYNMANGKIIRGPILDSLAISSTYDNLSGLTYVSTNGPLKELYILSPLYMSVSGTAPFVTLPTYNQRIVGMFFDWKTQDLYVDAGLSGLYMYTVQHFYRLTLQEKGLPPHTLWNFMFTGYNIKGETTGNHVSLYTHNGTYNLTGNSALKRFILYPYKYAFSINGKGIVLNLSFLYAYPILFEERGLPAGTPWYLNISDIMPSGIIIQKDFTAMVPNGTHAYSLATSLKIYSPVNHTSTFQVSGKNLTEIVDFYLVTYQVTVKEMGLYNGTQWFIVNSTGSKVSSQSSTIILELPNGTYSYNITTLNNYYMLENSISFVVHGGQKTVQIEYFHYAYVVGTTIPHNANVIINGKTYNFQDGNVNISLKAGYYTLKVTENGYNYFYKDFSVRPGQVENIGTVKLTKIPTLTPTFYYIFYGALIAAIVAMILAGVYFAVKNKDR